MRIGELAAQLGINPKTIRFYEAGGLLPEPDRTPAGYRIYEQADAERITFIKSAQRLGMSLDEIGEVLAFRDHGEPPCAYVRQALRDQVAGIDRHIADLARLRDQLVALDARAADLADQDGCYCGIIEHARPPDASIIIDNRKATAGGVTKGRRRRSIMSDGGHLGPRTPPRSTDRPGSPGPQG